MRGTFTTIVVFAALASAASAQGPENVLVVVNQDSAISRSIADYYVLKRHIPLTHVCRIKAPLDEEISRGDYEQRIARPVAAFLRSNRLQEQILYIVTTSGVPLRVHGSGKGMASETAAVDSELTLLYSDLRGIPHPLAGHIKNPFFGKVQATFKHPDFPIYLVTRLTSYDFEDVKKIVDGSLVARNQGKFVIDLKILDTTEGDQWLREAARQLPADRVILDETGNVMLNQRNVIGYASWGSNDSHRTQRHVGFAWLPGAIMTEFVSTNARTFRRPPESWTIGNWGDQSSWFAGSPQTMTGDYLHDGVTGASGHVDEPFLALTPRPNLLLPAYYWGRNLAESYYLATPGLSWMNIVVGDPLCTIGRPK